MRKLSMEQIQDIIRLSKEYKSYDQIAEELDITVSDVVRILHPHY